VGADGTQAEELVAFHPDRLVRRDKDGDELAGALRPRHRGDLAIDHFQRVELVLVGAPDIAGDILDDMGAARWILHDHAGVFRIADPVARVIDSVGFAVGDEVVDAEDGRITDFGRFERAVALGAVGFDAVVTDVGEGIAEGVIAAIVDEQELVGDMGAQVDAGDPDRLTGDDALAQGFIGVAVHQAHAGIRGDLVAGFEGDAEDLPVVPHAGLLDVRHELVVAGQLAGLAEAVQEPHRQIDDRAVLIRDDEHAFDNVAVAPAHDLDVGLLVGIEIVDGQENILADVKDTLLHAGSGIEERGVIGGLELRNGQRIGHLFAAHCKRQHQQRQHQACFCDLFHPCFLPVRYGFGNQ